VPSPNRVADVAIFVERVSELPRLLEALLHHPEGMSLDLLAAEVHRTGPQVRDALLAYYCADFATYAPDLVARPDVIEFFGGTEDVQSGHAQPMVRLVTNEPGRELGVAYASAPELFRLYRAGRDRLQFEPGNAVLRSAVEKLRDGMLPGVEAGRSVFGPLPAELHNAVIGRHRVRISYARAWRPGILDRVIDPYRLQRTRRGWEVDAGPVDESGAIRTYLMTGIQHHEVLEETFETPPDVDQILQQHRLQQVVELVVPHASRWAVDKYAEKVEVVEEFETSARLRAHLLQPVNQRLGLILIAGGTNSQVVTPLSLADAGQDLAQILLAHHEG
jgi:hypothetical protein